jgi:flagella synthesis protein FlgN
MPPNEPSHGDPSLISKLTVENAAWQALLNLMGEEERALIAGEADLLPNLNASKLAQLQTLNNLARARHDALVASGLSPDQAGMDSWLSRQGNAEHQTCWQQLCDMEQQAQAMNQRIGSLIDLRLTSTRQALNVLIHAAKGQGGLYDQAGMSVASRNGKPLTAA